MIRAPDFSDKPEEGPTPPQFEHRGPYSNFEPPRKGATVQIDGALFTHKFSGHWFDWNKAYTVMKLEFVGGGDVWAHLKELGRESDIHTNVLRIPVDCLR